MSSHRFTVGERFWFSEGTFSGSFRIASTLGGAIQTVSLDCSTVRIFAPDELNRAYLEGRLRFVLAEGEAKLNAPAADQADVTPEHPDFSLIEEEYQHIARFRYHVIRPLLQIAQPSVNDVRERVRQVLAGEDIALFTEHLVEARHNMERGKATASLRNPKRRAPLKLGLSVRSVRRWLARFRKARDVRVLVPHSEGSGRAVRVEEDLNDMVVEELRARYMRPNAESFRSIAETVTQRINRHNLASPSEERIATRKLATLTQLVRRTSKAAFSPIERAEAQLGEAAARQLFNPDGRAFHVRHIFERLEIDHTRLDIMCVDKEDGFPIGRPTLTFAVDRKSGYPAGWYLSFEPPSYLSVKQCLYNAIQPKAGFHERFPMVEHQWIASGIWDAVVSDNGAEFVGYDLEAAALQLRFELLFCPPAVPWFKASVERRFGTLNKELLHTQQGTTFSNVLDHRDYDASKHACLPLDKLEEQLALYFVDYYPHRTIRRLGGRPFDLFQEGLRFREPRYPDSMDSLRVLLGKVEERRVTSHGINLENLVFQSRELGSLLGDTVKVKYDPANLNEIWVMDPRPGQHRFITVPSTDPGYTYNLSLWKHKTIVRFARLNEERDDIEALRRAKNKIEDIARTAWTSTKKARTRTALARWRDGGRSTSVTFIPAPGSAATLPAVSVPVLPDTQAKLVSLPVAQDPCTLTNPRDMSPEHILRADEAEAVGSRLIECSPLLPANLPAGPTKVPETSAQSRRSVPTVEDDGEAEYEVLQLRPRERN